MAKTETIVIKHRSNGDGRMSSGPTVERRVVAYMREGTVVDHCHEVWSVRRGDDGKLYSTG